MLSAFFGPQFLLSINFTPSVSIHPIAIYHCWLPAYSISSIEINIITYTIFLILN